MLHRAFNMAIATIVCVSQPLYATSISFERTDSQNQQASGYAHVYVFDWCTEPTDTDTESDSASHTGAQFADAQGGAQAILPNCSASVLFDAVADNYTAPSSTTYTPNITSGAQASIVNAADCLCEFFDHDAMAISIAVGQFKALQPGIVYTVAGYSSTTSGSGNVGAFGGVSGLNMSISVQSWFGAGSEINGCLYDEINDDYVEFQMEFRSGDLDEVFESSATVSVNQLFQMATSGNINLGWDSAGTSVASTSSFVYCYGIQQ